MQAPELIPELMAYMPSIKRVSREYSGLSKDCGQQVRMERSLEARLQVIEDLAQVMTHAQQWNPQT